MKALSNLLHRTPWAVLLLGGVLVILGLAAFLTPFNLIDYKDDGATAEERRAIKREVDNAFADGALELARGVVVTMRSASQDPATRAEMDHALAEIDRAREELRDAGVKVLEAKREAVDSASEAVKEASAAIREAQRAADEALKGAGIASPKVREALEQSLKAAETAEAEAKKALESEQTKKRLSLGLSTDKDKPLIDIEMERGKAAPAAPAAPAKPGSAAADAARGFADGWRDGAKAGDPPSPPAAPEPPAAKPGIVLPPEVRERIRRDVYGDMRKMGLGAGLVLVFLPLFLLAIIAKVFIDRSRAAQRMADLRRKEAEFHRMSQQVTEAKLQALQAQVEPHFLYNTLANVQALTEVDPERAGVMVGHLIQYLRNALPKMRESISTVGQEIELVRAYLSILQMRMGKRLAFDIAVPSGATAMPFPPLMLPSLVENAIKHGLEPVREGGSVHISAQYSGGRLRLTVADTGRGFGETVGSGVGLSNLRERLAALYGEDAKLTLEANTPSGVIATIDVPADGLRSGAPAYAAASSAPAPDSPARQAAAAAPKTRAGKVLAAMGTAERAWRKSLSFAFVALVSVAGVLAGVLLAGILVGAVPVHVGNETLTGASGAMFGTAGVFLAFAAVVVAIAIVLAVIYGLGFMAAGLLIFIPLVIVISLLPALAPFVLLGLAAWWLWQRHGKKREEEAAAKREPVMATTAAATGAGASTTGSVSASTAAPTAEPASPASPVTEEPFLRRSESAPEAPAPESPPPLPPEDAPKDGPRGG